MKWNKWMLIYISLFIVAVIFRKDSSYLLMLTVAQVIYVPMILEFIFKKGGWYSRYQYFFIIPALVSVVLIHILPDSKWDFLFAAIYLIYTFFIATIGIVRFLKRGFIYFEEFAIDLGLINLSVGGMWFFAHVMQIDTGFSPIITWLTSIHFHYAACLLPIFIGLLGRIYKPKKYIAATMALLISPWLLALGITFSRLLEWVSVIVYIIGIYTFIYLSFQAPIKKRIQKWLIVISSSSLGVTILFSFLYATGNLLGTFQISIPFMLLFHGLFNVIFFGLFGVLGWLSYFPPSKEKQQSFPVSKIRGKIKIGEQILKNTQDHHRQPYKGLVDEMAIYNQEIKGRTLASTIQDFYENTLNYRLYARVQWKHWFIPFAAIYSLLSRVIQQINLPLSNKQVVMTGDIIPVNEKLDGRNRPRAWLRKIRNKVVFTAIYSWHQSNGKTYMNIALPLPFSSMIGILELKQIDGELQLSSKKNNADSDTGIYLAWKNNLFTLPFEEIFRVREIDTGRLQAQHHMYIFSLPFLSIFYDIERI